MGMIGELICIFMYYPRGLACPLIASGDIRKMNIRLASKTLLPLALALASSLAGAACLPVVGSVKLLPLPSCTGLDPVGGVPFLGQCFSVHLSVFGFPAATGYGGLTSESIVGANGAPTVTPAYIPVSPAVPVPRQSIQTARSAIVLGRGAQRTTLYSNDVIISQLQMGADGVPVAVAVTEQIMITGSDGKGAYAKVTGNLTIAGNSIGAQAPLSGRLCLP
jgi:hypothetical protein